MFEGKQRLWEKEVDELKRLYAAKLRHVSQHTQRSQRSLQLELFKAQQEKSRLQAELDSLRKEVSRDVAAGPQPTSPTLEESRWEVRVKPCSMVPPPPCFTIETVPYLLDSFW